MRHPGSHQRGKLVRALGATLLAISILDPLMAAQPQVPALPTEPLGYVKYAGEDMPAHFKFGAVAARDNTPADNLISDAGATLGRVLFYDTRLSHDNGTACASCHQQATGFSDPEPVSEGIDGQLGTRHSMALANSRYYITGAMFWDERAESLEAQAIAQFERAMVSYQSKYDTAFAPGSTTPQFDQVFTADELAGEQLFHGAGRCSGCHTTEAHVGELVSNIGLEVEPVDEGVGEGRFKTPSLRNIAVRGRFMHDGRFSTLQEVVEFYNIGVQDNPALDESLRNPLQLGLTEQEVLQLVAFMETLTDETFLTSELFSDPFVTLPGDYNGDGEVDDSDFEVWRTNYGDTELLTADGNNDGLVDAADYTIWRDSVGLTWESLTPVADITTAAPEPSSLVLVGLALVAVSRRR
ncbi:mauG [Symbiodinium sp. CCMP2456]|nr:mauG [Symbiodinium sp. CCMP2456]